MNKFGAMLGIAAAVALAGCADQDHWGHRRESQNEVKYTGGKTSQAAAQATAPVEPVAVTPDVKPAAAQRGIEVETIETPVAEPKTVATAPVEAPVAPVAAAPETTDYIVQRGDYLAKISKKFNVKLDALRKANPQLKNDVVMIGQKIKIPGKVEVGEQTVPEGSFAKPAKREYKPYSGATKDYVVKSGDTLGGIAYGNGINIRQLKELNGLSSDVIRVGQKLKIPAEKVVAAAATAPAAKKDEPKKAVTEKKPAAPAPAAEEKPAAPEAPVVEPVAAPAAEPAVAEPPAAPAAPEGVTHVVQEGEDITGLSIRYSVDPAEIRDLNNLGPTDEIKPGQVIKLPADMPL